MNLKLGNLLFFMVVADFTRTVSSFDSKCPALRVVNGRSKYRWRGRSVRFSCMRGFQLVGVKYAICMNGKWDADVPICVKYGCRAPSTTHVNGQFIESYRGAVVKIVCNPGYTLSGSPSVYCNGVSWNETFPVCRVKDSNPALFCDFEDSSLCGWSQDPMHDFDWKRQNGSTPSGDVGTGPTFDHTRGENSTGYYMYLESSSPRMENDAARLYSPVYPPEYSNGTCFKFWYHMYGATTGFLKVYVKPEGAELSTLIPSFWINGEQGKHWIESFFAIEPMESPFQIVIEGVRGPGAVGDTAFDDVNLTTAEECKILEEMTSSTEFSSSVNPDDDAIEFVSCENRCNQEKGNGTGLEDEKCSCYESCDRDGTCCADYFDFCYLNLSAESTTQTDTGTSTSVSYPSTTPSEEPENGFPSSTSSKPSHNPHFNNESNEIFPVPPQPINNRTLNEIPKIPKPEDPRAVASTTTHRPRPEISKPDGPHTVPNATTPPSTPEIPKHEGPRMTPNTTTFRHQPEIPILRNSTLPKKKYPKPGTNKTKAATMPSNASNEIPRREARPKAGGRTEGKADVPNTLNTTVTQLVHTTTTKPFKNSKPNNIKLTILEKPSSPNLSNEPRFHKGNSKDVADLPSSFWTGNGPPPPIPSLGFSARNKTHNAHLRQNGRKAKVLSISDTKINNPQFQQVMSQMPKKPGTGQMRNRGKEPPQAIKIDKGEGILEVGVAAVGILVVIILGVFFYRRRQHRKAERENMVEDSDSIVYEMDSSTLGSESHSLVCIRPGGLRQSP